MLAGAMGGGVHAARHVALVAVAEALHILELLLESRQPPAQHGGALLRCVAVGRLDELLGRALLNLGHDEAALAVLDELDLDVRDVVDERGANLDDLELNLDNLELAVFSLLRRADVQPEA